jgi:acyl-CoA synthetase (AMP-forming)/AMP-acid ligase II
VSGQLPIEARVVGDLLDVGAERFPDRLAVAFEGRRTSYRTLRERVDRLANALLVLGLRPGDRLALFLDNSDRAWELILACARAGLVWVPLNYMLKEREVETIVGHAGARALAVSVAHWPTAAPVVARLALEHVIATDWEPAAEGAISYEGLLAGGSPARPPTPRDPDAIFCLLYTSGTTGLPKGTMLTHRAVLAHAGMAMREYRLGPDSVGLVVLPYFVGATLNCVQIPGLSQGIPLVFARFTPEAFFELVRAHRVTHVQTVPTVLIRLLEAPELASADLSSVETIGYGSAPMPVDRLEQLLARFGPIFTQIYGLTETCAMATVLRPDEHAGARLASCGRAAPGVEVELVDDDGRPVGPGQPGEIVIRGPTLMSGYWRAPEATDRAVRAGWFHSGDVAHRDADGYIYISDRKTDMIITGGINVYPKEVEEVIYRHPGVLECAVVGLPDPEWGEAVTAVVAPRPGARVDPDEVVDLCRRELAGYKKPRRVVFVEEIPRNPSGKVLKRILRERLSRIDE